MIHNDCMPSTIRGQGGKHINWRKGSFRGKNLNTLYTSFAIDRWEGMHA
jgi:hypothetical protein